MKTENLYTGEFVVRPTGGDITKRPSAWGVNAHLRNEAVERVI